MEFQRPTYVIPTPWADQGTYETIPATQVSSGRASWDAGFPLENTIPVSSGGIPANYNDFQGVLHDLSEHTCYQQTGGLYEWTSSIDYPVGAIVQGGDAKTYQAVAKNGPNTSVVNPTTDSSGSYWNTFIMSGGTATSAVDASSLGGVAASGYVTTSGAQTINGAKTFSSTITMATTSALKVPTTSSFISFYGGTGQTTGARLTLLGKDNSSEPGYFKLVAYGSAEKLLQGKPDGSLTWDGSNVNTAAKPGVQLVEYTYNQSVTINADNALRVYFTPPTISGYTAQKVVNGRGNGILAFVVPSWSEADNAWVINVRASQQTANSMTFLIEYTRN